MKKTPRQLIAERRARARRRKRVKYATIAGVVLVLGALTFLVIRNRIETTQQYSALDPNKSKGPSDALVQVVEYGDFQ